MNNELIKQLREEQKAYSFDTKELIYSRGCGKSMLQLTVYLTYYAYSLLCDALALCEEEWTLEEAHDYIKDFVRSYLCGEEEEDDKDDNIR